MNEDKYEIIFLNDDATPLLSAAFDAVGAYDNLSPKRLDGVEVIKCFSKKVSKKSCFVLCQFEGACFEHLKNLGAAIYGPQIILHYVRENKALPKVPYPLFSTALIDVVATVTCVTGSEREHLLESIQMLHGTASRDLTDEVNVVITPKVGSKKYLVGASRGLYILLPSWIKEAWSLSAKQDPINMLLPAYTERFRVPALSQLRICVSGLTSEERKEVSDLVLKHGGQYSGVMKVGETTHLVVKQAGGVKFVHAKKWKIQIVSLHWLLNSVNKGYALDEEDYRVQEGNENSSTPTIKNNRVTLSFDNLSVISHAGSMVTRIDESHSDARLTEGYPNKTTKTTRVLKNSCIEFVGCTSEECLKLSQIIQELGGRICTDVRDRVSEVLTHIVFGSLATESKCSTVEFDVHYVKSSWLYACKENGSRVPEVDHAFLQEESKDSKILTADEPDNVGADDINLINQYFCEGGMAEEDDFTTDATKQLLNIPAENDKSLKANQAELKTERTIYDKTDLKYLKIFIHTEFSAKDQHEIRELLSNAGITTVDTIKNAWFVVAPFFLSQYLDITQNSSLVSRYWLDRCISEGRICHGELLREKAFVSLVRSGSPPLRNCVISLSGFVGKDRALLTAYAQALGAVVQECFLRKPVPARNLLASTHLIAAKPDGRKWPAAKQWGLPAVSRLWLYACADKWKWVDEGQYAIEATDATLNVQENSIEDQRTDIVTPLKEIQVGNQCDKDKLLQSTNHTTVTQLQVEYPIIKSQATSLADAMRTPDWVSGAHQTPSINQTSRDSLGQAIRPSPPLSEQVVQCLRKAVSRTAALPKRTFSLPTAEVGDLPLKGVVICVAKHLATQQNELNRVVERLGGDFKWTYNSQVCTHMVAERAPAIATANEECSADSMTSLADVQAAVRDGKYIVKPEWLLSCQTATRRLPEHDFPPSKAVNRPSDLGIGDQAPDKNKPSVVDGLKRGGSSLLGDVTRRLEQMLGGSIDSNPVTTETASASVRSDMGSITAGEKEGTVVSYLNPPTGLPEVIILSSTASTLPIPNAARRMRRPVRRGNFPIPLQNDPFGPQQSGVSCLLSSSDGNDCWIGTNRTDEEASGDLAHPGQSLNVRWQYDDATPVTAAPPSLSRDAATTVPYSSGQRATTPRQTGVGAEASIRDQFPLDGIGANASDFPLQEPQSKKQNTGVVDQQQPDERRLQHTGRDNAASVDKAKTTSHPVFSFSGLPTDERDHYAGIVNQLQGGVDTQLTISSNTTHLILHTPSRWMLHKSYLDACLRTGSWVDEEPYEWGGTGTEPLLVQFSPATGQGHHQHQAVPKPQGNQQIRELAHSARRWRLAGGKAFHTWCVVFHSRCSNMDSFRRIIEAGKGQVIATGPPYPPAASVTHAFFFHRNLPTGSDLSTGYSWLSIDYLLAYLTSAQTVERDSYSLAKIGQT